MKLTINLPNNVHARLGHLAERQGSSPEETASEIVRLRLLADRFHELCAESEEQARAAAFGSEDEILREIS